MEAAAGLGAFGFWLFIAAVVVAGIWFDARKRESQQETLPLQNSASVIAQVLSTSLVELEGGRLALMVAPINSIAGLIGMLLLGMQFLYRRMVR